jgi:hypothetical protein
MNASGGHALTIAAALSTAAGRPLVDSSPAKHVWSNIVRQNAIIIIAELILFISIVFQ